jgi:hypothetical protein
LNLIIRIIRQWKDHKRYSGFKLFLKKEFIPHMDDFKMTGKAPVFEKIITDYLLQVGGTE